MPNGDEKLGSRDRLRVADEEGYCVRYLVEKTGVTPNQAWKLLTMHGTDRDILEIEAKKMLAAGR